MSPVNFFFKKKLPELPANFKNIVHTTVVDPGIIFFFGRGAKLVKVQKLAKHRVKLRETTAIKVANAHYSATVTRIA